MPLVLLLSLLGGQLPTVSPSSAVLESSLAKPRPTGAYEGGTATLQLHSARNEVESFLVIVSGGAAGLTGVTGVFCFGDTRRRGHPRSPLRQRLQALGMHWCCRALG